jgi:c-di-GMP-specific phosphodiesterase
MSDRNLFGWKIGGDAKSGEGGKSGHDLLMSAQDKSEPKLSLDSPGVQAAALKAADTLLWAYDLQARRFEFRGSLKVLGLPAMWNRVFLDDLEPALAAGEVERLDQVFASLDVHVAHPGGEQDAVQCVLRLKDHKLVYLRGHKVNKNSVMGTIADLSRDIRLPRERPADDGLPLQDLSVDSLTGLLNRQGFLATTRTQLSQPGDYDLVVADVNRFRRLNEALGHERADLMLALLAQRLRDAFGETALLGRLGEDEFAVLTQRGFPRVSERMRNALERTLTIAGFDIHPTFSMGAVAVEGGETALDPAELLRRVEMAVELAQSKGAGGVAAYKRDLETDGLTRLALEADLRKAFVSGEIQAWFQPIVNLDTGVIAGFEALARWIHPKRGVIPPDHFLGAARDLGLMGDLGTIILNATVDTLKNWREAFALPQDFFISVNLSAPELERPGLVEDIIRLIREAGLPAKCLKLEVTESDVMRDPDVAARVLQALRDAGAGIAMDDFGTGFSSLSYLAQLPFDVLKVDRAFVITMMQDEAAAKLVKTILALGRDLGLVVVAEGVEDTAAARCLHDMGCGLAQGYGFSKPLKLADAQTFLARSLGQDLGIVTA